MCQHKNVVKVDHSKPGAYGDQICRDCGMVYYNCGWVGAIIFAPFVLLGIAMLISLIKDILCD